MSLANRYIFIATLYGVVGMSMGLVMGASRQFSMAPVHAHVLLLGWVSLALYGLLYRSMPAMAADALAKWQFWISNVGILVMMITLAMVIKGTASVAAILALSEVLVVLGMLLFAWLVWKHRSA